MLFKAAFYSVYHIRCLCLSADTVPLTQISQRRGITAIYNGCHNFGRKHFPVYLFISLLALLLNFGECLIQDFSDPGIVKLLLRALRLIMTGVIIVAVITIAGGDKT